MIILGLKAHDWCAEIECFGFGFRREHESDHCEGSSILGLLCLDLFGCLGYGIALSIILSCSDNLRLDLEIEDDRALVDGDDLNPMGGDTERACESVDEARSATVCEELSHGPVHADLCLNRILGADL